MNYEDLRKDLDSDEEVYFYWWLVELFQNGYIEYFERCESIPLSDPVKRPIIKQLKTKTTEGFEHVLHGSEYTPDFLVKWTHKAIDNFVTVFETRAKKETLFYCHNNLISFFEVKGEFDRNNVYRIVSTNIKWTFQKYGIFVNLVKIPELFNKTWTPNRFLKTNKSGAKRAIKFKTKNLQEYADRNNH